MAKNSPESGLQLDQLPDPGDRYSLGQKIGTGVSADVYEATDNQAGKRVAVKILSVERDALESYQEEYQVLRDLAHHPNLPDFYGIYLKKGKPRSGRDQLWFVMELCEGGTVMDLVRGLHLKSKKMCEEHIAFILKETIKSLIHLHECHVMHRDVKGSNILLTKEGEVKLVDFGLSRKLKNTLDRRSTIVGSPCWMAPEVINCSQKEGDSGAYDNRVDVWAIGITAIELGDGKPPFQDMHPTRALFQIMRNPPPTLYRPANWTQDYNDFIAECLEKNPEHRPYIMELMEHPFLTALPENDYHFAQELKAILDDVAEKGRSTRLPESNVRKNLLETGQNSPPQMMHTEDLAALDQITEDTILVELHERLKQGHSHTFVGDVLLVINPNEEQDIYGLKHHVQYQFKSRCDNAPHIFAVADRAYQDAMHHEEPQYVLLAGETLSGKTTNFLHLLKHLSYLGKSGNGAGDKLLQAVQIVHAMGNAATPINPDSTRHMLQMEVTFTSTGKVSGAILWLFQLEKWRVTTSERHQANFHILYYFYDAMEADRNLERYHLDGGRRYRYLRTTKTEGSSEGSHGPREDPQGNVSKFRDFQKRLAALDFDKEQQDTLWCLLAAILLLGEVTFKDTEDKKAAEIENPDVLADVARLLGVDEKKFNWALNNYCVVEKGTAVRRRHTRKEAEEARDVLARGIYFRLVDWVVNVINLKLSFTRAVFGDKYSICLIDLFGFECFKKNHLEQLIVNTLNEQLQYHYAQRVFVWEMQEQEEEEIPIQTLQFYDNKPTVDELMSKPDGLFYLLDEASRSSRGSEIIIETLEGDSKNSRLRAIGRHEFTVAHYTGKVTYDTTEMADKNRDFLPPEMIETLRLSSDRVVQKLFTNRLSKTGNLTRYNTESHGEYSQTRRMRTASATFRTTSLEILRGLAVGAGSGGTHFVRCMRADLVGQPWGFQPEVVRQQLRALAVLETARARQKGYPHRVPFPEFIRRYKFLAFDFDETVDVTKENSRLLLVRLKMEGWVIGKSKVFLKYYNEEFLSRSYEMQVKKIIKVQTMMRAFLAKRNLAFKLRKLRSQDSGTCDPSTGIQETKIENFQNSFLAKCGKLFSPIFKYNFQLSFISTIFREKLSIQNLFLISRESDFLNGSFENEAARLGKRLKYKIEHIG
uniref:Neither inactivation nor afterpotential protein C n=1 Tax=Timema genevievae TaxID=629358 RepID=A0A7R9JPS6_TIMGE|nr:unnamed protein product [Timema genevievae]